MLLDKIKQNSGVRTLIAGLAAAAVTSVVTMTGSASASFEVFDASVDDPGALLPLIESGPEPYGLPLPSDPHDEAIVMGWERTDRILGPALVQIRPPAYQGDDHDTILDHVVITWPVYALPLPADPHDEAIVMGWEIPRFEPSIGEFPALVLPPSYHGDETDPGREPVAPLAYFGDESDQPDRTALVILKEETWTAAA